MTSREERHRIVIVGGGLAGIEAALYLRAKLGDHVSVTIVSASDRFTYRPFLTYIPFGLVPEMFTFDLDEIARAHDIRLVMGHVDGIDPKRRLVQFGSQSLTYDSLILATGARMVHEPIAGLRRAYTVWDQKEMLRLRGRLARAVDAAQQGERCRVLFLISHEASWPGPTYELAIMMSTWIGWKGLSDKFELTLITSEQHHLQALGAEVNDHLAQNLRAHGIRAETGRVPVRVDAAEVVFRAGEAVPFDILINAANYLGAGPSSGLDVDERGFYRTRLESRQLLTHDNIYAVGDGSDHPVKQGFLALLQADAAAENIASRVLGQEPEFGFDADMFWVMEELDEILVAHGDAEHVQAEQLPAGRLHRLEAMGYLPHAQLFGNPLYSGLLWKGTEVGLNLLRRLPATA